MRRHCLAIVLALVVMPEFPTAQTQEGSKQDSSKIEHAKRVLDLLVQEKFDEVAKEFDEKMTVALPVEKLRAVWTQIGQQAGKYRSAIDQQVTTPAPGITVITLGSRFENADINVRIAFDGSDKIAGMFFIPRPPAKETPAVPPSPKFRTNR
jgi:Protein of unknown function (DUF3887)